MWPFLSESTVFIRTEDRKKIPLLLQNSAANLGATKVANRDVQQKTHSCYCKADEINLYLPELFQVLLINTILAVNHQEGFWGQERKEILLCVHANEWWLSGQMKACHLLCFTLESNPHLYFLALLPDTWLFSAMETTQIFCVNYALPFHPAPFQSLPYSHGTVFPKCKPDHISLLIKIFDGWNAMEVLPKQTAAHLFNPQCTPPTHPGPVLPLCQTIHGLQN